MATRAKMNVCVVGHGMMGAWHSNALRGMDCSLHMLVGRRPEPTRQFAERYGFGKWVTDLEEALEDDEIDIVIIASPSERHADSACLALERDKHTLVEIPLAMKLADGERIVEMATRRGLMLGVVHPLRVRPELVALRRRIEAGEEHVRHIGGRFFIHRLENVGATGYRRSWTDNLLWHHMAHLVDVGVWVLGSSVTRVDGFMPSADPLTGTPMEVCILVETDLGQSLVCTGSYYGRERIFDLLVITDRDSYRLDVFQSELTTGARRIPIASEEENCALVTRDFVEAVLEAREPRIPGTSVLPAMRILESVQRESDRLHGEQALPGRPQPS